MVSQAARRAARGRREGGFSLVMLVMVVTVLGIGLAAALPRWSEMIRRDKEEELISRGFQYVEAIRLFQRRFQRYPTTLDELIKVKPRCIRRLWKDPMTENGRWAIIYFGQGAQLTPISGVPNPAQAGQAGAAGADGSAPTTFVSTPPNSMGTGTGTTPPSTASGLDPNGQQLAAGPIVGVRSHSTAKSFLVFYGHEHYNEWEFRIEMLTRGAGPNRIDSRVPNQGMALSTRWLGRPMETFAPVGNGLQPSALGPSTLAPGAPAGANPPMQQPPPPGGGMPPPG